MAFERVEKTENDPIYDAYFNKYASSPDDLLRKYDYAYREFGDLEFSGKTYALDKDRGAALFRINKFFRIRESRRPGTYVLFLKDEMIIFNLANNYSRLLDGVFVENVFEIMPFDPPFDSFEKEKMVQEHIVEGLTAIGYDGTPYGENERVGIRVVFNAKFDGYIF